MPKKKDPPLSPEEQRKRFEQMAKRVGAHGSQGDLKKIVERIAKVKKKSPQPDYEVHKIDPKDGPIVSKMDEPDFSPSFARKAVVLADGQTWRKPAMFVTDDYSAYDAIKGDHVVKTWRPGVRMVQVGPEDYDADCDGEGYEVREIAAVVTVSRETSRRVLYRRSWLDPDGRAFGKRKMRMTTASAFASWVRGSNGHLATGRQVAELDRDEAAA